MDPLDPNNLTGQVVNPFLTPQVQYSGPQNPFPTGANPALGMTGRPMSPPPAGNVPPAPMPNPAISSPFRMPPMTAPNAYAGYFQVPPPQNPFTSPPSGNAFANHLQQVSPLLGPIDQRTLDGFFPHPQQAVTATPAPQPTPGQNTFSPPPLPTLPTYGEAPTRNYGQEARGSIVPGLVGGLLGGLVSHGRGAAVGLTSALGGYTQGQDQRAGDAQQQYQQMVNQKRDQYAMQQQQYANQMDIANAQRQQQNWQAEQEQRMKAAIKPRSIIFGVDDPESRLPKLDEADLIWARSMARYSIPPMDPERTGAANAPVLASSAPPAQNTSNFINPQMPNRTRGGISYTVTG